jgi:uncharacterized RDD family membrane protein YckC
MAATGITVLKHNVPWGPFTRGQIEEGLARGDFTVKYLAHAAGLSEWLPLGEVLDYVAKRESSAAPALPPIPETRELPVVPQPAAPIAPPAPAPAAEVRPMPKPPELPAAPPKMVEAPPAAKPQAPPVVFLPAPQPAAPQAGARALETAPFFLRTIAFLVDCGVLFLPVAAYAVLYALSIWVPTWFHHVNAQTMSDEWDLLWLNTRRMAALLAIGCGWLYAAFYESSHRQATIGKRWMGLRVTDAAGGRISFLRATGRYLAKFPSALPCFLGFVAAIFSSRGLALHDRLAGTRVVRD